MMLHLLRGSRVLKKRVLQLSFGGTVAICAANPYASLLDTPNIDVKAIKGHTVSTEHTRTQTSEVKPLATLEICPEEKPTIKQDLPQAITMKLCVGAATGIALGHAVRQVREIHVPRHLSPQQTYWTRSVRLHGYWNLSRYDLVHFGMDYDPLENSTQRSLSAQGGVIHCSYS